MASSYWKVKGVSPKPIGDRTVGTPAIVAIHPPDVVASAPAALAQLQLPVSRT